MDVKFVEELPQAKGPGGRARRAVSAFAHALMARPGVWAEYRSGLEAGIAHNVASTIRHGRFAAFRPGYEATARDAGDGTYTVYVRFVGEVQ